MIVFQFKKGPFVCSLRRGSITPNLNSYWISVYCFNFKYVSLYYPKDHAYKLFVKLCNFYLNRSYISY